MNPYPLNSELSAGIFESSTLKAGMRAMGLLLPDPQNTRSYQHMVIEALRYFLAFIDIARICL